MTALDCTVLYIPKKVLFTTYGFYDITYGFYDITPMQYCTRYVHTEHLITCNKML